MKRNARKRSRICKFPKELHITPMDSGSKTITIANVDESDVDKVSRDYIAIGADISTKRQPDGKWRLEITIRPGSTYPASGVAIW